MRILTDIEIGLPRSDASTAPGALSAPMVSPDGVELHDAENKRCYDILTNFADGKARGNWNSLVLEACVAADSTREVAP
jgi:hypothetical protein